MKASSAGVVVRAAMMLAAIGGAVAASEAVAAQTGPSFAVRYSPVELLEPEGVARVYARIRTAADWVCGPRTLTGSILISPAYVRCFNDAVERAVAGTRSAQLAAWHQQHAVDRHRQPPPV